MVSQYSALHDYPLIPLFTTTKGRGEIRSCAGAVFIIHSQRTQEKCGRKMSRPIAEIHTCIMLIGSYNKIPADGPQLTRHDWVEM